MYLFTNIFWKKQKEWIGYNSDMFNNYEKICEIRYLGNKTERKWFKTVTNWEFNKLCKWDISLCQFDYQNIGIVDMILS